MIPLPFRSPPAEYELQATDLLARWNAGDRDAIRTLRHNLPRFLDERVPWMPKDIAESELRATSLDLADTRLALARWYSFRDWPSLVGWVTAVTSVDSPVARFESAVEAIITGDAPALQRLLRDHPELVRERSMIVTHNDPPEHRATLLHYVAANGVEGYRQKSPTNAVEVATLLLRADAEPDALAAMYGDSAPR
jgi:hypothetical protein